MADIPALMRALYTRQQVAALTGMDDSTLNYWMREGVLRAAEGGGGKGQHRRFAYHQVNLALLLDQLRGFGVALPALKQLASRFHDAVSFMDRFGITRANVERITTLLELREQIERNGFIDEFVFAETLERLTEACPWIKDREFETRRPDRPAGWLSFKATLSEAIDVRRKGHIVYNRESPEDDITDELVELSALIDRHDYYAASRYWSPISYINDKPPGEYYSTSPDLLYRGSDGAWDIGHTGPGPIFSYVGIDLEHLTYRAWIEG